MGFLSDAFKGAGGSIVSGLLGAGASMLNNSANQSHADFWARQNIALQKEFAQNSIKWRIEDAKRAGVHPMAALGIQPASFSPVSTSFQSSNPGAYLADMGQNIDRAIMAGKDNQARAEAENFNKQFNALQLEKGQLENDLLRIEIASKQAVMHTGLPPAAPSVTPRRIENAGQPNSPVPDGGYSGAIPLFTLARHGRTFIDVINPDIGDSISESAIDSARAKIAGVFEAQNGYVKPPLEYLTKEERQQLKDGKINVVRIPLGWEIRDSPLTIARKYTKRYNERKYGPDWMHPENWKWLEDFGNKIKGYF